MVSYISFGEAYEKCIDDPSKENKRRSGFIWSKLPKEHHSEEFDLDEVETCIAFLSQYLAAKTKTASCHSPSSYGLKHRAEKWGEENGMSRYVSNGAMIVAAHYLGFPLHRSLNHPSADVGFSMKVYRGIKD